MLTDLCGRIADSCIVPPGSTGGSLGSELPSGLYFVVVETRDGPEAGAVPVILLEGGD